MSDSSSVASDSTQKLRQIISQKLLKAVDEEDIEEIKAIRNYQDSKDIFASVIDEHQNKFGGRSFEYMEFEGRWMLSPIASAVHHGRAEVLSTLLEYATARTFDRAIENDTSKVEIQNADPTTVSLQALIFTQGDAESIFSIFCNHGLDISKAKDCDIGRVIWFWAIRRGFVKIVQAYLDAGFPVNILATESKISEKLWENYVAPVGSTGLWNAADQGQHSIVKILLEYGAELLERLTERVQLTDLTDSLCNGSDDGRLTPESSDISDSGSVNEEKQAEPVVLNELMAVSQRLLSSPEYRGYLDPEDTKISLEDAISIAEELLQHGAAPNPPLSRQPICCKEVLPFAPPAHCFAYQGAITAVVRFIFAGMDPLARCGKGRTLLHYAAASKNLKLVKWLAAYIPIDLEDDEGYRPIHLCAIHGTPQIMVDLIKLSADVNSCTKLGISPLLLAISVHQEEIVKVLLANGADPNKSYTPDGSPSMKNWTSPLLEEPMFTGASASDPNMPCSPLLVAIQHQLDGKSGDYLLTLLEDYGVDPTAGGWVEFNYEKKAELKLELEAIQKVVDELGLEPGLEGRSKPQETHFVIPPLYTAMMIRYKYDRKFSGREELTAHSIKLFLRAWKKSYSKKNSAHAQHILDASLSILLRPLHIGGQYSNENISNALGPVPSFMVKDLLELGANPNIRDEFGRTALHLCCNQGANDYIKIGMFESDMPIEKLVSLGADINARDNFGRTPLHYAAISWFPYLEVLCRLGADVSIVDNEGKNALEFAFLNGKHLGWFGSQKKNLIRGNFNNKVIQTLLLSDPGLRVDWGMILRHIASASHHTMYSPLEYSACMNLIIRKALAHDRDILYHDYSEYSGGNILHAAVESSNMDLVHVLCADHPSYKLFSTYNRDGRTPLIIAASNPYRDKKIVQVLLFGIANLGDEDPALLSDFKQAICAIRRVVWHIYIKITRTVLGRYSRSIYTLPPVSDQKENASSGAQARCLNMTAKNGWTALHYIADRGDLDTLKLLLSQPGLDPGEEGLGDVPSPLELAGQRKEKYCQESFDLLKEAVEAWRLQKSQSKVIESFGLIMEFVQRLEVRVLVIAFVIALFLY